MTFSTWIVYILYLSHAAPNDININNTIVCDSGYDCEINCDASISRMRGCYLSHIYCASSYKCNIICGGGGCFATHIYARNASYLGIKHANGSSNMTIYCPFYGRCAFDGDYPLNNAHIHTVNGFDDITLKGVSTLNASHIYCGEAEEDCVSNKQGTKCLDNEMICNTVYDLNKMHMATHFNTISFIAVAAWLFIAIFIIIIALIYHERQTGSDSPAYFSVFKSFVNIADFYTDIVFCAFLLKQNSNLYIAAMIFTLVPHMISVIICMLYIDKWRHHIYKIGYIKRYDSFVITATVLMGFVPVIQMLTSKLFYASRLTLQIATREKIEIQRFNLINHNLLEDIPLIMIQVVAAFHIKHEIYVINIALVAFIFSSLSITVALFSLSLSQSKCVGDTRYNGAHIMTYEIEIKSNRIDRRHHHCHRLFAECLCKCLEADDAQIETVSVIPIVDGIACRVEIHYNLAYEIDGIDAIFKEIINNVESDRFCVFQTALCNRLHMRECSDLNVMISRLDLNGLKATNTLYIPLKLRNIDGTNSTDIRAECEAIDEEFEPLKQQKSLLLETMRKARVNNDIKEINITNRCNWTMHNIATENV